MAVIRDKMPAFQLFQPASTDEALGVLDQYGADAWVLAGGLDTWDWLKDRVKKPAAVVDLGGVSELSEIRSLGGGLEIGAMATLREVIRHPEVSEQFSMLADSASQAASPQIQNQGTLGGNVGQDTRCWYYRDGWSCYRAGGNICYADTPTAMNREHAILGASRCVAVNPSDTAPVLVALDAEMVVRNSTGERVIPAQDFFIGPAVDIMRMTALQPGDILTSIRIPWTWANTRFYFEKARDRAVWTSRSPTWLPRRRSTTAWWRTSVSWPTASHLIRCGSSRPRMPSEAGRSARRLRWKRARSPSTAFGRCGTTPTR